MALLLVSQGTPQTMISNFTVDTIEGKYQDFAMGPVAALESIKHLGTNGGGFFGANSTTPFENPTVISDIAELISMMILPGACVVTFGHMLHDRKKQKLANAAKEAGTTTPAVAAPKKKRLIMGRQGAVVFALWQSSSSLALPFAIIRKWPETQSSVKWVLTNPQEVWKVRKYVLYRSVIIVHHCNNILYNRYS